MNKTHDTSEDIPYAYMLKCLFQTWSMPGV